MNFRLTCPKYFSGNTVRINSPHVLIEPRWTLSEAQFAVAKLKSNNAAHGCGLVAELLKPVPPEFLMVMVDLFNYVLYCFMAILPRHGAKHFSKNFRKIKNCF